MLCDVACRPYAAIPDDLDACHRVEEMDDSEWISGSPALELAVQFGSPAISTIREEGYTPRPKCCRLFLLRQLRCAGYYYSVVEVEQNAVQVQFHRGVSRS